MISKTILVTTHHFQEEDEEGLLFSLLIKYGKIRKLEYCRLYEGGSENGILQIKVTYFNIESAVRALASKEDEFIRNKLKIEFYIKSSTVTFPEASFLIMQEESPSDRQFEDRDDLSDAENLILTNGIEHEVPRIDQLRHSNFFGSSDDSKLSAHKQMLEELENTKMDHEDANIKLERVYVNYLRY